MELVYRITKKGKVLEGKMPDVIDSKLESAMYEATSFLEREVKKRTPTGVFGASGGLVSTIYGEVLEKGRKGIVGSSSPYGEVVEKGRRAGKKWPPEGALIRWIELKTGVSGDQAKRLEFVIRRKIEQKGFPGVHMFQKAFDEGWPRLKDIFDNAGFEITRELDS